MCAGLVGAMMRRRSGEMTSLTEREHDVLLLLAEGLNAAAIGAKLYLSESPKRGTIFVLELPMPLALRNHGFRDGMYVVKALVRHIEPFEGGYLIGMEFQD